MLKQEGAQFEYGTSRLEDRAGVLADIERVRWRAVVAAAGCSSGSRGYGPAPNATCC
jgi:hypothetical protein